MSIKNNIFFLLMVLTLLLFSCCMKQDPLSVLIIYIELEESFESNKERDWRVT